MGLLVRHIIVKRTILPTHHPLLDLRKCPSLPPSGQMASPPPTVLLLKSPPDQDDDGRKEEDAYVRLLSDRGYRAVHVPTLEFRFPDPRPYRDLLSDRGLAGLALTSPRAIEVTARLCREDPERFAHWAGKPVFVVGPKSGERVERLLGWKRVLGRDAGNAANLVPLILEELAGEEDELLFPHGNLKLDILPTELRKAGRKVRTVEVYETRRNGDLDAALLAASAKNPDFVVFFSPSGVKYSKEFFLENGASDTKFVALGPSTETAISQAGLPVFGVASAPSPEKVLEVLLKK